MSLNQIFEPDTASACQVRRFVGATLSAARVDGRDVEVVVNELATNAILHGRTEFSVSLELADGWLRAEIADRNPRMPAFTTTTGEATSGHGFSLVQALCKRWGVERRGDGKVVWCEIPLRVLPT